jgi:alpha/beta superfamily hydrolase
MTINSLLFPRNAQQIFIDGPVGKLDTLELLPNQAIRGIAIIFHPDPKGGGTYTNKIVQTLVKVMNNQGYICYCPNLRGVGLSDGNHDMGIGEIDDGLAVYNYAIAQYPDLPIMLGGFSFGCSVASNLAQRVDHKRLILIGPAVKRYNVVVPDKNKTLIIHGQDDEVIPLDDVYHWLEEYNLPVAVFAKTGHFFHGKLLHLQNYLTQIVVD